MLCSSLERQEMQDTVPGDIEVCFFHHPIKKHYETKQAKTCSKLQIV